MHGRLVDESLIVIEHVVSPVNGREQSSYQNVARILNGIFNAVNA